MDVPDDITLQSADQRRGLWTNLEYFLKRTLPVAEKAGVKMSMQSTKIRRSRRSRA